MKYQSYARSGFKDIGRGGESEFVAKTYRELQYREGYVSKNTQTKKELSLCYKLKFANLQSDGIFDISNLDY